MKAALISFCIVIFIGTIYSLAYVDHYCTASWHCGADTMMLVMLWTASVIGIFYAIIEMK